MGRAVILQKSKRFLPCETAGHFPFESKPILEEFGFQESKQEVTKLSPVLN